jgi:hypothetical protein
LTRAADEPILTYSDEGATGPRRPRTQPKERQMTKISNSDEEKKLTPDESRSRSRAADAPAEGDTEGHMFQPDYGTSRHIANSRNAEIERELKDRLRRKEAESRQNRR